MSNLVDSLAGRYNIKLNQYATYKMFLTWKTGGETPAPINNAGWRALLQVRTSYESPQIMYEASTENGSIRLEGSNGRVVLRFNHLETGKLKPMKGIYDLLMISPQSDVYRILEGDFIVLPGVTRYTGAG